LRGAHSCWWICFLWYCGKHLCFYDAYFYLYIS